MRTDPDFVPCEVKEGDEIWSNGIFHFNISRMLDDIESGRLPVARETINVKEWFLTHSDGSIDEDYMPGVVVSGPVI